MPRRIQTSFTRYNNRRIPVIGDSLTLTYSFGFMCRQYYPTILQGLLNNAGCHCMTRNFGIGGQTSGQIAQRMAALNYHETPDLAIIWAGVNDFGNAGVVSPLTYSSSYPSGLTCSGTTATFVSTVVHGLQTNDAVTIAGATPSGYNGTFTVSVIDQITFQYTVGTGSLAVASGTITSTPAAVSSVGNVSRTQANLQAAVKGAKFGCVGWVTGQASLPVGKIGQRYVVMNDTDSTGGAVAITPNMLTTITGSGGNSQTVWEYRLPLAGNLGWGRVATATTNATNATKVIVVGTHYMNWSASQGDTQSSSYSLYNATNGLRAAQITATASENNSSCAVVYCNLYDFFSARIAAGLDTQGSHSWHVADANVHLNAYGQSLVGTAIYSTVASQSGWIAALS